MTRLGSPGPATAGELPTAPCPTEAAILAYVDGVEGDDAGVGAHIEGCTECRRLVGLLAGEANEATGDDAVEAGPRLRPGDVVLGKYEIVAEIGRGGMGVVVKAFHRRLGQPVALKLLLGAQARDTAAVARFFREARAAAALGSPHVVRVLDADRLPSGEPFLALEHLEGRDLAAEVRARGPLPVAEAVDMALDACEALALAHRHGIVHRDIKPSNLFATVASDGRRVVKVLDFGVAKVRGVGATSGDRTNPVALVGSPRYMPPEQLQGPDVDARADVWALAASLFELLTGQAPFAGATLPAICAAITHEPPARLSALRSDAPRALGDALARALRKDRRERTPSIVAFAADLAAHGTDPARLDRIRRVAGEPAGRTGPERRGRRTWPALAAFAALALVAMAAVGLRLARPRAIAEQAAGTPATTQSAPPVEPSPTPAVVESSPTPAVLERSPAPATSPSPVAARPTAAPPPARQVDAARSKPTTAADLLHRDGLVDRK